MFPSSILLMKYIQSAFAHKNVKGLCTFLEHMTEHELEASNIYDTLNGIKIVWENGFNKTHVAEVIFYNKSAGLRHQAVVGMAVDTEKPGWEKKWVVTELSLVKMDYLQLTIDETLEYIRHFIWANHNV